MLILKTQPLQYFFCSMVYGITTGNIQVVQFFAVQNKQGFIFGVLFQLFAQFLNFLFQFLHFFKSTHGHFQNGFVRVKTQQVLMQVANRGITSFFYCSFRGCVLPNQYF